MTRKYIVITSVLISAIFAISVAEAADDNKEKAAAQNLKACYLRTFNPKEALRFEIVDHIKTPQYHWPRTLLVYPVRFEGKVNANQLCLRDLSTGKGVPLQLSSVKTSNGSLEFAEVNFFCDLPSGGKRQFELSIGSQEPLPPQMKLVNEAGSYVLDAGSIKVRIPASVTSPEAGQRVPGPIMALRRDAEWIGESFISSPKRKVKSLTTEIIENGPLFIKARMTYDFDGGASYVATVKAISGYDFVEFYEEMKGLTRDDDVFAKFAWTGFHPNRRGKIPLDKPQVNTFRGEDPAFEGPTRIEDPAKELLVRMEITPSNGGGGRQEVGFSDDSTGRELGLFIQDVGKWDDREYAIWVSHDTLVPIFRFADKVLYWDWPIREGTRATGIAYFSPDGKERTLNYFRHLYGDTSLNRVKDWILEYPEGARRPAISSFPTPRRIKSADECMKMIENSSLKAAPSSGYGVISIRDLFPKLLPGYIHFQETMTPEQRERATALLLFCAYYSSEEANNPMLRMLGGHPNFMSDLKAPLMGISFIFPDHPMVAEWKDHYEKFLDVSGRFNTRPAVPLWEARGGRWTESLATYNWAYLSPALEAARLSIIDDSKNRFAQKWHAMMGDYLLNTLTAPVTLDASKPEWPEGTPLTVENGFHRIHPPQGAHSSKRGNAGRMRAFGELMARYAPLLSEYMIWSAQMPPPSEDPKAKDKKNNKAGSEKIEVKSNASVNRGTNPHLKSAKYTGYGIVMRAGVDTPDEIAVFLQQIDKGPNYRWGYPNQNGSGDIYYYAGGKSFSGHGFEDTGDRHGDDALYTCNTGVYKDHHYHCIGMNCLVRPFYNLDVAQFAELVSEEGPGAYSWPEYRSRSVMLVGTDYIVVYDALDGWSGSRFVWTSNGVYDEMPNIIHIKGGGENVVDMNSRIKNGSRGTMWDSWKAGRSRMMIVSHKKDVQHVRKRGERIPFVRIKTQSSEDYVFQNDEWQDKEFNYTKDGVAFAGRTGLIRRHNDGKTELALFHGSTIGANGVTVTVDDSEFGVSLSFSKPSEIKGTCFGRKAATMNLVFADSQSAKGNFYLDGEKMPTTSVTNGLKIKIPPGQHRWECTSRKPEPMQSVILRTENFSGGAKVFFTPVAGAQNYRLELSSDSGATWQTVAETTKGEADLSELTNGTKVHVRVVAFNSDQASRPANEYPVYVTDKAPLPPDGLKADISENMPKLSWGEVLGVTEYRLYRREKGNSEFSEIFRGLANEYVDKEVSVPKAFSEPGIDANFLRDSQSYKVYEYAVSAVNGNGESSMSVAVDTDPQSWLNWNPATDLRFKRRSGYWRWPYTKPEEQPPLHYPSDEKQAP